MPITPPEADAIEVIATADEETTWLDALEMAGLAVAAEEPPVATAAILVMATPPV
jgi:predicted transcriptional regulator